VQRPRQAEWAAQSAALALLLLAPCVLAGAAGARVGTKGSSLRRPARETTPTERFAMNVHVTLGPIVSLIAGILILVIPRLLNYIVALYLIIIGLLGIFG
jgi:Protein of unknown function (DUF3096)